MDRTAAMTYLTNEYSELASNAKWTSDQTTTAYTNAIDMSLRQIGTDETDLATADVEQSNVIKYIALLNYYALKRFDRMLAIQFDVSVGQGAVDAKRSQAYNMVKSLLDEAEQECINLGLIVGGSAAAFQMGTINLDFNEPGWRWEGF